MLSELRWAFVCSLAITGGAWFLLACTVTPAERPTLGRRGAERVRAMKERWLFALAEPGVRFLAGCLSGLPLHKLRARERQALGQSDDALGLSADEFSALSLISSVTLGATVAGIAQVAEASPWYGVWATLLGLALPWLQLREVIRRRAKLVTRALPPAIEIASMCMGAGLDFPGSLRMLAERNSTKPSPLGREFAVILEQLEFGHTRKEALLHFAERVPARAVVDFVHAVVQAEQKGNPLARVLQVQGRMLNLRRSVAAEEAAARAGVLMIVPLVFLLGSILLLLMGPFMVKGIGW